MLKKIIIPLLGASLIFPLVSHAEKSSTEVEEDSIPNSSDLQVTITPEGEAIPANTETGIIAPFISDPDGWQSRGFFYGKIFDDGTPSYIPASNGVNWRSAGGNFQVRLTNVTSNIEYLVGLYEYDPDNADDLVDALKVTGNTTITFSNIGSWVDGDNEEAEFYIKTVFGTSNDNSITAEGFD